MISTSCSRAWQRPGTMRYLLTRRLASAVAPATTTTTSTMATTSHYARPAVSTSFPPLRDPNPEMVDARQAPANFISSSAVVYRDFATQEEADCLTRDVEGCLKRQRYQKGHWDSVIVNYKETELIDEGAVLVSDKSKQLLERIRYQLQERHLSKTRPWKWLPCHVIDLHKEGELHAHVDSVKFSGDIVAGLSLLSPSIMRLVPNDDGHCHNNNNDSSSSTQQDGIIDSIKHQGVHWIDLYLPPRSLYVLADAGRYHYSHRLLPSGSVFYDTVNGGEPITVEREHRISIIFRDSKDGIES